mmetsp:Transcript_31830/g.46402  ORF Transcript_31830/g.46402 Transcript_31830/m.46402 type:complete len:233 (-) Transcript_31830:64-762(-)
MSLNQDEMNELLVDWPSSAEESSSSLSYSIQPDTDEEENTVRFSHATKVMFVEIDEEEIPSRWYKTHDYTGIIKSANKLTVAMREAASKGLDISIANSENGSIRGLEGQYSKRACQERITKRIRVRKAVLEEQLKQRISGIENPLAIAAASILHSQYAKDNAARYGREDAEDAIQVQKETQEFCLMTNCRTSADSLCQNTNIATPDLVVEQLKCSYTYRPKPFLESFVPSAA